jgi:hypothetical protein
MDWQQIVSLIVVAATAVLLARYEITRRQRAKLGGCVRDCCGATSETLEILQQKELASK